MKLTKKLLEELQRRLKTGNRRGVHLNAIPGRSRYKFDLNRLSYIDEKLPNNFVEVLLSKLPLKFKISWQDNVDLNSLFEEDQIQLVRITKAFENLINQTEAIESEKGINTFGFGFPILVRRDRADNKLTVAPILIWSLRIKRTREFNTWEIRRSEDDPIYINEVLINHLQSDSSIEIEQIPNEMLDDGLIDKNELIEICSKLIRTINTTTPDDLQETFRKKLEKIVSIKSKKDYENLSLNSSNSFIEFGGLFSIYKVQKQNIINDYSNLMDIEGIDIDLGDIEGHYFQPISSVETDPSQQSILHSLETTRNILIQGPPGTGKSQTLTAVLINALENNKKTIVVCEKRTALEVLHNALNEKGLNRHCVLIRDIVKDRKTVVDSVRGRVNNNEFKHYSYQDSKQSLGRLIESAENEINIINKKHQKLDKKLIEDKSWSYIVGNWLAELKENTDDTDLNIENNRFNYSDTELYNFLELVKKGQKLYTEFSHIESKSFINPLKLSGDNPYLIEQKINEDFTIYSTQLQQIKNLIETVKREFIDLRQLELENQTSKINDSINKILAKESELDDLVSSTKEEFYGFRNLEFKQQSESISKIISNIKTILDANEANIEVTNAEKVNSLGFKLLSIFSKSKKQIIADHIVLQSNSSKFEECLKESKDFQTLSFSQNLDNIETSLHTISNKLTGINSGFNDKIKTEFNSYNLSSLLNVHDVSKHLLPLESAMDDFINSEQLRTILKSIHSKFKNYLEQVNSLFQQLSKSLAESKDIKLNYAFEKSFYENKIELSEIKESLELIKHNFSDKIQKEFEALNLLKQSDLAINSIKELQEKCKSLKGKIDSDNWVSIKNRRYLSKFIEDIERILHISNDYFNDDEDLFKIEFDWFKFYNGLSEENKKLIDSLKPKNDWKKVFLINYLGSLLQRSATADLPVDDEALQRLDNILNEVEKKQLKFIKEFWFSKEISATREFEQQNVNLSIENLYNKRSSRRFKRLSLRQIVQRNPDLFTSFFPIILTSPDVASNLFKKMNGYFDIVMFDEASQLKLEDNLPAILKGKQIIIAGDEHQMPPSNYFSKIFDGFVEDEDDLEDEEEQITVDRDNILLSCESLLEFATELNFQRKHLDFHYRSRHPYLIDFSNHAFYNQRLKPLPNNFDYVPIKYVQVNGTFSEHTNEAEAEMVLSIIDKNINRFPDGEYPTLGIATFNITQRNLIKSKILERQKFPKFAEFNAKVQELEENGMFIKNLENIQGDERDVIILSTTYGIKKDGNFAERFGPINHKKGYKLLNVIITRAKFKLYCITSIPESKFLNYKDYLISDGSNTKSGKASFFAYLAYCKAISERDNDSRLSVLTTLTENTTKSPNYDSFRGGDLESPFEEEVFQSLADRFGTEKLIPQFKFAGFRIDIVYDSKIIGVPKIAIECDGAKYHSSREAYLYDLHRQKILEKHGFVFHRIWSTNWWRNSKKEMTKLVKFIKQNESMVGHLEDHSQTASAFTDNIEKIEDYILQTSSIDIEKDSEIIEL